MPESRVKWAEQKQVREPPHNIKGDIKVYVDEDAVAQGHRH